MFLSDRVIILSIVPYCVFQATAIDQV